MMSSEHINYLNDVIDEGHVMNIMNDTMNHENSETQVFDVDTYLSSKGKSLTSSSCHVLLYQLDDNWYLTSSASLFSSTISSLR